MQKGSIFTDLIGTKIIAILGMGQKNIFLNLENTN